MKWTDDGYFATETRDLGRIRRVLVVTMILNFSATALKLGAGLATGALSVVADGLDSLFDGISNIAGLAGLVAASKPPDANYPYGHRKFETLAALSISFLLFLTAWELLVSAWERLGSDIAPAVNLWTGAALLLSIAIQALTSAYELREGRRQQSEVLVADALHTRASILVSLSVLFGLVLVQAGFPQADPILAGFVALVIIKIGVDILRETLPVLADKAAVDPRAIADVVRDVQGVESFHRVRSRGALGSAAVDLHIRVSPEKTIRDANAIADEVRQRLLTMDDITDVTVHLEAQRRAEPDAENLYTITKQAASEHNLTVHEVWMHRIGPNLHAEIHVGFEPQRTLAEAHQMVDRFEMDLRERLPALKGIHTHIELAPQEVQTSYQASPEVEQKVRREVAAIAGQIPELSHPHNILIWEDALGSGKIFVSLDCLVAPETSMAQAHHLASVLEQKLSRQLDEVANVSVHLEPAEGSSGNSGVV